MGYRNFRGIQADEIGGDYEKACQKIWSMLDYLVPDTTYGAVDDPVRAIVMEEAEMYFAKGASLEGTVNKIQKRVQLMLDEN